MNTKVNSKQAALNVGRRENSTKRLVQMAMLAAVSIVLLLLVRIPLLPAAPYLEYDMADIPILLGAYMFGSGAGLLILFVVSVIQAFLLGGNGIIGLVMHFIASGLLVLVASLIFKAGKEKNRSLIVGLIAGVIMMTLVMIPLNLLFTPLLFGLDVSVVKTMIIPIVIPFNLLKGAITSTLFIILFKSLRLALRQKS